MFVISPPGTPFLNQDGTPMVYQPQNVNQQVMSSQQPQPQPQQQPHPITSLPSQPGHAFPTQQQMMSQQHAMQQQQQPQPIVSPQHPHQPMTGQFSAGGSHVGSPGAVPQPCGMQQQQLQQQQQPQQHGMVHHQHSGV